MALFFIITFIIRARVLEYQIIDLEEEKKRLEALASDLRGFED